MVNTTATGLPFELDGHGISTTPAWRGHEALPFNLVLEGGSMRGLFTAGVLDLFMERGIVAEDVIGVSAGALNALNYVLGAYGRTAWINCRYCTDARYLSLSSFARTGNAFGREMSFDLIPNELEPVDLGAVYDSPMTLTTVASDLDLGEADYHVHRREDAAGSVAAYLCASSSMPFVSQIVQFDGKKLLDGGVCDSVPVTYSRLTGARKHVLVLTREAGYVKGDGALTHLATRYYADYPLFAARQLNRAYEYNRTYRQILRLEAAGEVFVIRPQHPVTVSHMEHDPLKLVDLYAHGYGQALESYDALMRYLER